MKNGVDSSRNFPESGRPFFLLSVLVNYVAGELALPFPSSPATLAESYPLGPSSPTGLHPGLCCLPRPILSPSFPKPDLAFAGLKWSWGALPRIRASRTTSEQSRSGSGELQTHDVSANRQKAECDLRVVFHAPSATLLLHCSQNCEDLLLFSH